jgi:HEAT repeat protein
MSSCLKKRFCKITSFFFFFFFLLPRPSLSQEAHPCRNQILYLLQKDRFLESLDLYNHLYQKTSIHDFELLQQWAELLLKKGSRNTSSRLLDIYSHSLSNISSPWESLETGLVSNDFPTQLATLQCLAQNPDDRSEDLLNRAMSSDFLYIRLEAAQQLSFRKSRRGLGQIEALMHRLPPFFKVYFPSFFTLIGTSDAIHILRHLMQDSDVQVRISAILSAAEGGRDDLLPLIRLAALQSHPAQQEACATALGWLKDSKSSERLEKLTKSTSDSVRLAAYFSLYSLGRHEVEKEIVTMAHKGNLFAITLLGQIPTAKESLLPLLEHKDLQIRCNAALSLLQLKEHRALPFIQTLLIPDSREWQFQPHFSPGRALIAWKIVPPLKQGSVEEKSERRATSLYFREKILKDCLELEEKDFLELAHSLLKAEQTDLIPLVINLVENLQTEAAVAFLKENLKKPGSPLVRTYCALALFRLKPHSLYQNMLKEWILKHIHSEMIQFRPVLPMPLQLQEASTFELTPEENSHLLIESCLAIAKMPGNEGIDLLLRAMKEGHVNNRFLLAGLLLQVLQ